MEFLYCFLKKYISTVIIFPLIYVLHSIQLFCNQGCAIKSLFVVVDVFYKESSQLFNLFNVCFGGSLEKHWLTNGPFINIKAVKGVWHFLRSSSMLHNMIAE